MGSPLNALSSYGGLSLWHETTPTDWTPRTPLEGDAEADVAIVGAGYTGLWTAYYLSQADPALRIVVLDAEVTGFGASGRNGGWCSALFPTSLGEAQDAAMRASVDEVQRVALAEGIDCHFAKGGTIVLARNRAARPGAPPQYGDQVLSPAEAGQRLRATRTLGATYTRDCAAIHPGRLVRGLAEVVSRHGVGLSTSARRRSRSNRASSAPAAASVRAPYVVRATEGFTPRLPGLARALVPVYSLIVATGHCPPAFWGEIGLRGGETFTDHRHLIVYGQRTADDRLVFGGRRRALPPALTDLPRPSTATRGCFAGLRAHCFDLFPVLRPPFHPRLGRAPGDPAATGAGVGLGPARARLGRRLRRRRRRDHPPRRPYPLRPDPRPVHPLTALPWVGHRSRSWEPEPLRWLGMNAGLRLMTLADAEERLTRRPSVIGRVMAPLVGGHSA